MKKIFRQLFMEFWFPLLIAVIWTFVNVGFTAADMKNDTLKFINMFGPTFFLISWLSGQYFRVKKQLSIEKDLTIVENQLLVLAEQLDQKTNHLINSMTGDDSFFYYKITEQSSPDHQYRFAGQYLGEYPIHRARIMFMAKNVSVKEQIREVRNVSRETISRIDQLVKLDFQSENKYFTSIVFGADNKTWIQTITAHLDDVGVTVRSEVYLDGNIIHQEDYHLPLTASDHVSYTSVLKE